MDLRMRELYGDLDEERRKNPLERHLLVTVSDHEAHLCGLRFVGHFFADRDTLKVTLFYVAPLPPAAYGKHDFQSAEHMDLTDRSGEERGRLALDRARLVLLEMGFPPQQVATRFAYRQYSTALDIVTEGHRGLYDAVILGHRATSALEQIWQPSVGKTILETNFDFPMWVCRDPDYSLKSVLLCVDGSASSLAISDHVGFILGREHGHEITLFTVETPSLEDPEVVEHIFGLARKTLVDNGFPAERIRTRTASSAEPAKAILREAQLGRYAVVAMGRTGRNHGFLKRIFLGSVSSDVFHQLTGAVLWVCQ